MSSVSETDFAVGLVAELRKFPAETRRVEFYATRSTSTASIGIHNERTRRRTVLSFPNGALHVAVSH